MAGPSDRRLTEVLAGWLRRLGTTSRAVAGSVRPPLGYPRGCEARARLADGRPVLIRPILPADAAGLRDGFLRLSPEDVRRRFGQALHDLSPAMLTHLTTIDYRRHMALVAIAPGRSVTAGGWGVARYVMTEDPRGAEFAVTVRSDMQRLGIGSLLLSRLLAFAAAQGIEALWGDVLSDNSAMLALARKFGFTVERSPREAKLTRICKRLDPVPDQALA